MAKKRCRFHYNHYSYQSKLDIDRYAYVYGNKAAARKYSKELGVGLCERFKKLFKIIHLQYKYIKSEKFLSFFPVLLMKFDDLAKFFPCLLLLFPYMVMHFLWKKSKFQEDFNPYYTDVAYEI